MAIYNGVLFESAFEKWDESIRLKLNDAVKMTPSDYRRQGWKAATRQMSSACKDEVEVALATERIANIIETKAAVEQGVAVMVKWCAKLERVWRAAACYRNSMGFAAPELDAALASCEEPSQPDPPNEKKVYHMRSPRLVRPEPKE